MSHKVETYVPEKPCRRGHSLRFVKNRACVDCARMWRDGNPDYQDRYLADPSNRDRYNRRHKNWKTKRKEVAAGRVKPLVCEVCEQPGKISFDHCHATGAFRGWLCDRCNVALGMVRDDPAVLRRLAAYLEMDPFNIPSFEAGLSMGLQ
jgi:hypothetical protein